MTTTSMNTDIAIPFASVVYKATPLRDLVIIFPYLHESNIRVYIDNVRVYNFTIIDTSRVRLSSIPDGASVIEIRRVSDIGKLLKNFFAGNILLAEDLNQLVQYHLFTIQELTDRVTNVVHYDPSDNSVDLQGKPIHNLGDPIHDTDAVSRKWVDDNLDPELRRYVNAKWAEITRLNAKLKLYIKDLMDVDHDISIKYTYITSIKPVFEQYVKNINDYLKNADQLFNKLQRLVLELKLLQPIKDNLSSLNKVSDMLPKLQADYKSSLKKVKALEDDIKQVDTEIKSETSKVAELHTKLNQIVIPDLKKATELRLENDLRTHEVVLKAPNTQNSDYTLSMPEATPIHEPSVLACDTRGQLSWQSLATNYMELKTLAGNTVRIYLDESIKTDTLFTLDSKGKITVKATNNNTAVTRWEFEHIDRNWGIHIMKEQKKLPANIWKQPNKASSLTVGLLNIPITTGTINVGDHYIFVLDGRVFRWMFFDGGGQQRLVVDVASPTPLQPVPHNPQRALPTKGYLLHNIWIYVLNNEYYMLPNKYLWDTTNTNPALILNTEGFFESYE